MIEQTLIIARCAIFAILSLLVPVIHAQVHRWIYREDFGAWQAGYIASLAAIILNYYVLTVFAFEWLRYLFIFVDIIVCVVFNAIIQRQAITKQIARSQSQQTIISYITNKIIFLTTLYCGLGVSAIAEATNSTSIEATQEKLMLYEMYDISATQYISDVVLLRFEQMYSISTLLALFLTLLITYFSVRWYVQAVSTMDTKYKMIYTIETFLVLHSYSLLVFSKSPPITWVICLSMLYTISLILWWWFVDSEFDAKRQLKQRASEKI